MTNKPPVQLTRPPTDQLIVSAIQWRDSAFVTQWESNFLTTFACLLLYDKPISDKQWEMWRDIRKTIGRQIAWLCRSYRGEPCLTHWEEQYCADMSRLMMTPDSWLTDKRWNAFMAIQQKVENLDKHRAAGGNELADLEDGV